MLHSHRKAFPPDELTFDAMGLDELQQHFPFLQEPALQEAILANGREMSLKAGEEMMKPGQYIKAIPLVLEGRIRISRLDGEGGEVLLYFLSAGQTCAMSLSCCMADQKSAVMATVEEDAHFIAVPVGLMDPWISQFSSWRAFIMQTYGQRFNELLQAFDAVAFLKLDERILKHLEDRRRVGGSDVLIISHQEIAQELHSSREVVSRLLKRMERDGFLKLGRNRIELSRMEA